MGVVKDRTRKSKDDSKTLVGKQNKSYEWGQQWLSGGVVRLSSVGDNLRKRMKSCR